LRRISAPTPSLFFDEKEAIEELQNRGYRIIKEEYPTAEAVTTVRELVDFFYSRRQYYNPDRKFPFSIDYSADIKYISSFVKSRQKLGLGRKAAVAEAAELVDALFAWESHLFLKTPVISPAILAVRPIMDRVCSFLNGEVSEVNEAATQRYVDEINEWYDKKFGEREFQQGIEERRKLLEELNEYRERRRGAGKHRHQGN
jgi:hypothetical protein